MRLRRIKLQMSRQTRPHWQLAQTRVSIRTTQLEATTPPRAGRIDTDQYEPMNEVEKSGDKRQGTRSRLHLDEKWILPDSSIILKTFFANAYGGSNQPYHYALPISLKDRFPECTPRRLGNAHTGGRNSQYHTRTTNYKLSI